MLFGWFQLNLDWLFCVFCAVFDWLSVSSSGDEYFDHGDEGSFKKH